MKKQLFKFLWSIRALSTRPHCRILPLYTSWFSLGSETLPFSIFFWFLSINLCIGAKCSNSLSKILHKFSLQNHPQLRRLNRTMIDLILHHTKWVGSRILCFYLSLQWSKGIRYAQSISNQNSIISSKGVMVSSFHMRRNNLQIKPCSSKPFLRHISSTWEVEEEQIKDLKFREALPIDEINNFCYC